MADKDLLRESLTTIERLQARLDAANRAHREQIAIVGVGCRFPGGIETLEDLWRVVSNGVDAVADVPPDRWDVDAYYDPDPQAAGKMISRRAGMLDHIDLFDPLYFGISPREAEALDPQQRLLLETSVEALESAAIPADKLAGSLTGVFIGATASDYGRLILARGTDDIYAVTGNALNSFAGRIAFTFGLQGPCLTIDTACSSGLTAVHAACQALRAGECDLAIAGGVNVILIPDIMVMFSRWGMLAPDGRCKTFDSDADGMVRAEGCGVVVLKRLSAALAAGDPIRAVIIGSAINADGRSSGLTVPNGMAQEGVLRTALRNAGINAADVDYVETHGTGTSLGDPIEVEALAAAYGQGRKEPLLLGAVKANLGHTEAASGLAGLLKAVAVLEHEAIPAQIHYSNPNPKINWAALPVRVANVEMAWRRGPRKRRAGVSAFGLSGSNAHVIIEEAPAAEPPAPATEDWALVPLSAHSDAALPQLAQRHADALSRGRAIRLADAATTLARGRAHLPRRFAAVAASKDDLVEKLRSFAEGELRDGAAKGVVRAGAQPRIAFLFTGQGAQYPGMGAGLYKSEPVFRDVLDRADAALGKILGRSLLNVLYSDEPSSGLSQTAFTQPALYALEIALTELWRSWGVTPSVVLGHSVGEYAAACAAGVFSLENGLELIAERGRLMQALPPGGSMGALFTGEAEVARRIAPYKGRVAIAAFNAPEEIVISGDADAVEAVLAAAADEVGMRRLDVSHAFHSHRIAPMLDAFEARAREAKFAAPRLRLVSNLTGDAMREAPDAAYWRRHAREPVHFAKSIAALKADKVTALVEIGPHPTLLGLASRAAPDAAWVQAASLRQGREDRRQMLEALGRLYAAGANPNWEAVQRCLGGRRIVLPSYPFQRERFWIEDAALLSPQIRDYTASECVTSMLHKENLKLAKLASLEEISKAITPFVDAVVEDKRLDKYGAFFKALDRLCALFVVEVLRKLGWNLVPGDVATPDLSVRLGVLPRYSRLFSRMLLILAEDGVLEKTGDEWRVIFAPSSEDPEAVADALLREYPECSVELLLTRRCSSALAQVLRGETDPMELLFPGGALGDAEQLYQFSPVARFYNELVGRAVAAIAANAGGRTLRILEVGAGTGATTAAILEFLGNTAFEYTFTDVSPVFLKHAQEKFADYPSMRFELLDLERDPAEQGFKLDNFDVVVGANVAHATRDVRLTCERLRSLLASDGRLALLEVVMPVRSADLTFGMLAGWWAFVDTQRRSYALMSRPDWHTVMREAGFAETIAIPPAGLGLVFDRLAILIAVGQSAAPTRVQERVDEQLAAFKSSLKDKILTAPERRRASADGAFDLMAELRAAVSERRRALLDSFVVDQLRRVLALSATQDIDFEVSLLNLGMDSLMAMELRNQLQAAVGVHVAAADLIGGATAADLSRILFAKLAVDGQAPASNDDVDAKEVEWEEGHL